MLRIKASILFFVCCVFLPFLGKQKKKISRKKQDSVRKSGKEVERMVPSRAERKKERKRSFYDNGRGMWVERITRPVRKDRAFVRRHSKTEVHSPRIGHGIWHAYYCYYYYSLYRD
jgi:hypothetical protein